MFYTNVQSGEWNEGYNGCRMEVLVTACRGLGIFKDRNLRSLKKKFVGK